jgi:hypothetical protein
MYECSNGLSGFIKCGEFFDWLETGWLDEKGFDQWSE